MKSSPTPREVNHAAVLDVLRRVGPTTRPDLERLTGLGRRIVADRVHELERADLVREATFARSTGGRMPREVAFNAERGVIGVAEMNVHHITVGIADLAGTLLAVREIASDVSAGPSTACREIAEAIGQLLAEASRGSEELWGVGVGVPAPVEPLEGKIASGHLFDLTMMAGWDGFLVRQHLVDLLERPVWVSNEVDLMALGEHRAGRGRHHRDMVFAKLGPGIGAGLILDQTLLQRVAAGEIGHLTVPHDQPRLCWCGRRGCLFSFVEEKVLLAEYHGVQIDPDQPPTLQTGGAPPRSALTALVHAADHGDRAAEAVLRRAGGRIGSVLAGVVTLLNPSLVLLGGALVTDGSLVANTVRTVISEESMRIAQSDLAVEVSPLRDHAGIVGAAFLATDALLSPRSLAIWLDDGTPVHHAHELAADFRQS